MDKQKTPSKQKKPQTDYSFFKYHTITYREKIHELIACIDAIYDDVGRLRDFATAQEKKHWNDLRRILCTNLTLSSPLS